MKKYIDEANRLFLGIQLCFEIAWSCTEISAAGWVRFFRSLASGNLTITELTKRQDLGITPCLAIHVIHWYKKTIAKRVDYPLGPRIWFRVYYATRKFLLRKLSFHSNLHNLVLIFLGSNTCSHSNVTFVRKPCFSQIFSSRSVFITLFVCRFVFLFMSIFVACSISWPRFFPFLPVVLFMMALHLRMDNFRISILFMYFFLTFLLV